MISRWIIFFICLTFFKDNLGQPIKKDNYIIITYEDHYDKSFHGSQNYYWVIPVGTLKSFTNNLYPLFLSNFTKSQLASCDSGFATDPTMPSVNPGDYDFDSTWNSSYEKLKKLLNEKRRLIQTVKKIKYNGNTETIRVYATAIVGEFHACELAFTAQQRFGYKGIIFIAGNFSKNDDDFWNSSKSNFILNQDYSTFNFRQIY